MNRLSHLVGIVPPPDMPMARKAAGTDHERYRIHRVNARKRGVEFLLTFEEWRDWWHATGHYHEYGRGRGQYVMGRKGDVGPYALGNIECTLAQVNSSAPHTGKPKSAEFREKLRAANTGRKLSPEARRRMSESATKAWARRKSS